MKAKHIYGGRRNSICVFGGGGMGAEQIDPLRMSNLPHFLTVAT